MDYTLNIVLDVIKKYNITSFINSNEHIAIKSIKLFEPEECYSPETLYVGFLSEVLKYQNRSSVFLCLRDRIADDTETELTMRNIIVVNTNVGIRILYNEVISHFTKVHLWQEEMKDCLLHNGNVQTLMDLSEPILENHIAIMGPALKLIACTRNIDSKDPVTYRLIKYGYHPEATLTLLREYHRIEEWTTNDDLCISSNENLSPHTTILKSFKVNGCLAMIVTMVCCNKPKTPGLIDLYNILLENIHACMLPSLLSDKLADWKYGQLIGDLISGPDLTSDYVRVRSDLVGLDFDSDYILIKFSFSDPDNTPLISLAMKLSDAILSSTAVIYNKSILLLLPKADPLASEPSRKFIIHTLLPLLKQFFIGMDVTCGVSDLCHTLMQIRDCYRQADAAVQIGRKLGTPSLFSSSQDNKIFFYDDLYLFDLAQTWHSLPGTGRNVRKILEKIIAYDDENDTDSIRVLYWFLYFERKATETGNHLHLHRNTVLYRIDRIYEYFGLDLDDYQTRIATTLELHWLVLNGMIV